MSLVKYFFSRMINGCFTMPTEKARALLPADLEPVEPWHGASLLAITLFEFGDSPVGPYQEVVMSLFTVPWLRRGERHPHAAVYPLLLGSSNRAAREHAIDLWHLPHYPQDIRIRFTEADDGRSLTGTVLSEDGSRILQLAVGATDAWTPLAQHYQSFQQDDQGSYLGRIDWEGTVSDHEDGRGALELASHPFCERLVRNEVDTVPVREIWIKDGVEVYHPLVHLERKPA